MGCLLVCGKYYRGVDGLEKARFGSPAAKRISYG